jgi:diadenosine tetraphosphate (Ap4A) HIT family hydrolase
MIENLYKMKPLEEWLDKSKGCVYSNEHAFLALNAVPSTFGHSLVAPIRVVSKLSELSDTELRAYMDAKENGGEQLRKMVTEVPRIIMNVYDTWNNNPALEKILPGSTARRNLVVRDLESGACLGWNYFENMGESAGQMIAHFHGQITPRYGNGKGVGTAIFNLTHPQNS